MFDDCTQLTVSFLETTMWTRPESAHMGFGFEVALYIAIR